MATVFDLVTLNNIIGTNGDDLFTVYSPYKAVWGRNGNDTFYSKTGLEGVFFIGGDGSDSYVLDGISHAVVAEYGTQDSQTDTVILRNIPTGTWSASIIDDRHLFAYIGGAGSNNMDVLLLDFLSESNGIEYIDFQSGGGELKGLYTKAELKAYLIAEDAPHRNWEEEDSVNFNGFLERHAIDSTTINKTLKILRTHPDNLIPTMEIRGNSIYTIVDGQSWTQAESNSAKLGGHLVTINDANENSFITTSFSNQIFDLAFIGNNDIVSEGVWRLPSGESQTYANWANGEPNDGNSAKNEDVAAIYFRTQDFGTVGVWNDVRIDGYGNISKGIAEIPFIRRGDSAYVIVQGPTWEEAEANAVKLGGHLVTINDAAENEWIANAFQSTGLWSAWIGLNDRITEGVREWSSRDYDTRYRNWYAREAIDFTANDYALIQIIDNPNGQFGAIKSGQWIFTENTDILNFIDTPVGIAEIRLAPNNKPTGTPTLSDTTKVGQVIMIDKTPVQDADNFTGYTPVFKYSWEISTNGTTWTPITTTDATDNNATYTLTTAEVGKQIRGVVNYMDGYGTQESVASAGSLPIQSGINLDIGTTSTTASKTTTLASTISRLTLTGTGNINGTGNALNNYLTGNDGNNVLDGGAGNDILAGGKGNDTFIVDSIYDSIIENANEGIDLVKSSVSWTLGSNLENLTLTGTGVINGTGNTLNNVITGNGMANILDGLAGADTMRGGLGDDIYIIDNAGDRVEEEASAGTDTVQSSITYTLGSNLENLTLTGTGVINGTGNTLNNVITGNGMANILDGLAGADTMRGGLGDDTYIIDNAGDMVTELAAEGTDTVKSSITYTLAVNLENLTLLGSAAINGTGNSTNNILTGNTAANVLNGNGGADTLIGGRGNDTYIVDSSDDTITETGTSRDIDLVQASVSWVLGLNLENLTLTGISDINGTGNTLNNTISGNDATNILDGGNGGTDRLTGLAGADTFWFSTRPSSFRNSSADHITDFSSTQGDKIQISKSAFGISASTATLSVVSGEAALNTALSGSALFVYNTSNGELHWNQNGITRGAGWGGVLAILDNKTTLSAGDLMLV